MYERPPGTKGEQERLDGAPKRGERILGDDHAPLPPLGTFQDSIGFKFPQLQRKHPCAAVGELAPEVAEATLPSEDPEEDDPLPTAAKDGEGGLDRAVGARQDGHRFPLCN